LNAENLEAIERRLRNRRTDSEDAIRNRLAVASEELKSIDLFDFVVMNRDGEMDKAASEIDSIMRKMVGK
jgi:guanylate kinase